MNISSNVSNHLKWKNFEQSYNDLMIKNKKLPIFFDFYIFNKDFNNVYEPAEDTFLMIDCLQLESDKIVKNNLKYTSEIGCGSGLVSACFVNMLKNNNFNFENSFHFCVDINKDALDLTQRLFIEYELNIHSNFIQSNLFQYFIENKITLDLIIFNPPYVTTDIEEMEIAQDKKDISAAWAGGKYGSEIIFLFIEQLEFVINNSTIVYLLLSEENEYSKIIHLMNEKYNFKHECLLKRKAKNENLAVFKFYL